MRDVIAEREAELRAQITELEEQIEDTKFFDVFLRAALYVTNNEGAGATVRVPQAIMDNPGRLKEMGERIKALTSPEGFTSSARDQFNWSGIKTTAIARTEGHLWWKKRHTYLNISPA